MITVNIPVQNEIVLGGKATFHVPIKDPQSIADKIDLLWIIPIIIRFFEKGNRVLKTMQCTYTLS